VVSGSRPVIRASHSGPPVHVLVSICAGVLGCLIFVCFGGFLSVLEAEGRRLLVKDVLFCGCLNGKIHGGVGRGFEVLIC
jgi:hypothetical protein